MNPENPRTAGISGQHRGNGPAKPLRRGARPIKRGNEPLARGPQQDRNIKGLEPRQAGQQGQIMFKRFAKADPRIGDNLCTINPRRDSQFNPSSQERQHLAHHIIVNGIILHCARSALRMHQDDAAIQSRRGFDAVVIMSQRAYVIPQSGAGGDGLARDAGLARIDRNHRAGFTAQRFDNRQHAVQLFGGRNRFGARTRGLAANVEYVGAVFDQRHRMVNGRRRRFQLPAIGEGIRRDVHHAHDGICANVSHRNPARKSDRQRSCFNNALAQAADRPDGMRYRDGMERARPQEFNASTAAHRLGQYCAWNIERHAAIDMVWVSKAHARNPAAHRVLPHGEPSIAIRRLRDGAGEVSSIDLTVCGPYRKSSFYVPLPGEELIAIRLKPETAAVCFGVAPAVFFDAPPTPASRKVYDACSQTLRCAEGSTLDDIVRALMRDLSRLEQRAAANAPREAAAAAFLRRTHGAVSTKALAHLSGLSERHLRRRFLESVGATPKTYGRQLRLTAAALAAERHGQPHWAHIAAAAGFHDQAHMINEFQSLLSMTPQALHRERRALSSAA